MRNGPNYMNIKSRTIKFHANHLFISWNDRKEMKGPKSSELPLLTSTITVSKTRNKVNENRSTVMHDILMTI